MSVSKAIRIVNKGIDDDSADLRDGLDADEIEACENLAHEDSDVADAIQQWALLSIRGRSRSLDEAFCDRLEILLSKQLFDATERRNEVEKLLGDEHEMLGIGS